MSRNLKTKDVAVKLLAMGRVPKAHACQNCKAIKCLPYPKAQQKIMCVAAWVTNGHSSFACMDMQMSCLAVQQYSPAAANEKLVLVQQLQQQQQMSNNGKGIQMA